MRNWYYFDLKFKTKPCCCKAWFTRQHSNPAAGNKAPSPAGLKTFPSSLWEHTEVSKSEHSWGRGELTPSLSLREWVNPWLWCQPCSVRFLGTEQLTRLCDSAGILTHNRQTFVHLYHLWPHYFHYLTHYLWKSPKLLLNNSGFLLLFRNNPSPWHVPAGFLLRGESVLPPCTHTHKNTRTHHPETFWVASPKTSEHFPAQPPKWGW